MNRFVSSGRAAFVFLLLAGCGDDLPDLDSLKKTCVVKRGRLNFCL